MYLFNKKDVDSNIIDIEGLDLAEVIAALRNHAQVTPMGYAQCDPKFNQAMTASDVREEKMKENNRNPNILEWNGYLWGRRIDVSVNTDPARPSNFLTIDCSKYNKKYSHPGQNLAQEVIDALKASLIPKPN